MALRISRRQRATVSSDQLIPIVADGAIGTKTIGDGRLIPLIIFDAQARPDLAELVRVHVYQETELGDATCQWARVENADDAVALMLTFRRPVELTGILQFDLPKYGDS